MLSTARPRGFLLSATSASARHRSLQWRAARRSLRDAAEASDRAIWGDGDGADLRRGHRGRRPQWLDLRRVSSEGRAEDACARAPPRPGRGRGIGGSDPRLHLFGVLLCHEPPASQGDARSRAARAWPRGPSGDRSLLPPGRSRLHHLFRRYAQDRPRVLPFLEEGRRNLPGIYRSPGGSGCHRARVAARDSGRPRARRLALLQEHRASALEASQDRSALLPHGRPADDERIRLPVALVRERRD
jgi:hypothetical protein